MSTDTTSRLFCKNFTLLMLGQISSLIGNYSLKFALSMYILDLTGSATIFATIMAVAMIPTILLSPLGGILADRVDRRRIMVVLDTLSGSTILCSGILLLCIQNEILLSDGSEIYIVGALLILLSIFGAFESPTVQACIPQILSGENIIKGNAATAQVSAIASLITPFIGSLLYSMLGIEFVIFGTSICFFITAGFELFIRLSYHNIISNNGILTTISRDFSEGMRFLRHDRPDILKLLLFASLVSLFLAGTAVVGFPYIVRTILGLSTEYYAISESAMGVAAIFGSIFVSIMASRLHTQHLAYIFIGFGISLIPIGMVFILPVSKLTQFIVTTAIFCICQFGCSIFSTYSITLIQSQTPGWLMGKVMSYVFTLSMCAQPFGQLLFGWLFDKYNDNLPVIFIFCGLAVGVVGTVSISFFKHMGKDICK